MSTIKLISLNAESHKHLDRIIPFLQQEQPDVVNLQEIFEVDVPTFTEALGMTAFYQPMAYVDEVSIHQAHALGKWGLLQLSRLPVVDQQARHYFGNSEPLPRFFDQANPNSMNRVLSWIQVETPDGQWLTVATTHFTWSAGGSFTEEQARDYQQLQMHLDHLPEFVLTGDFNSPRQGEATNVFNTLAKKYRDNIPPQITTSIDGQWHKAGPLQLMVDGLFTTPEYTVSEVRMVDNLSDHQAVVGVVNKAA